MSIYLRRREFIAALGGAAAAWPLAAHGQRTPIPTIGFLDAQTPDAATEILSNIRRGLEETGFIEGRNLTIEYRFAENDYNRLPSLAADLVSRRVAVIGVDEHIHIIIRNDDTPTTTRAAVVQARSDGISLCLRHGGVGISNRVC